MLHRVMPGNNLCSMTARAIQRIQPKLQLVRSMRETLDAVKQRELGVTQNRHNPLYTKQILVIDDTLSAAA